MGTPAGQCYKNSSDCQAAKVIVPKWRDFLGVAPPLRESSQTRHVSISAGPYPTRLIPLLLRRAQRKSLTMTDLKLGSSH